MPNLKKTFKPTERVTNVEPWPKSVLKEHYKKRDREWEKVEDAATKAQWITALFRRH